MSEFDERQPALLNDQLNNNMIPWRGERQSDWHHNATRHDGGLVEWDGIVFDGRCEPLRG